MGYLTQRAVRLWCLVAGALLIQLFALSLYPAEASAYASWQRDSFTVVGFDFGDLADTSRYTKINNAGFDLIVAGDTLSEAERMARTLDTLRLLHPTFQLKVLATYSRPPNPGTFSFNTNAMGPCATFDTTLCRHLRQASVKGYMVWDEPCTTFCAVNCGDNGNCFVNVEAIVEHIDTDSCTAGRLPYVNLLPFHGTGCFSGICTGSELNRYRCYLDSYLSIYSGAAHAPPVLSVDHYPFQLDNNTTGGHYTKYFQTLKVMRDKAAEYHRAGERVPMWMGVQLSPWDPVSGAANTQPTINQVRWQVYCALAYGAKGIGYFTLAPRDVGDGTFGEGILTASGATTAKYAPVRTVNKALHALGPTLMKLDPIATYHQDTLGFEGLAEDLLSNTNRVYNIVSTMTEADGGNEGMVGYFKHRDSGEDYLLVVNKSTTTVRSFTLTLTNTPTAVFRVTKDAGTLEQVAMSGSSFDVLLNPGDGELFQVVDSVEEYIPKVNVIAVNGDRTYFAHDKGTVMVNTATGYRVHACDGTVYTPHVDLALTASGQVYVCQTHSNAGNVVKYVPNLTSRVTVWNQANMRPLGVATATNRAFIASRRSAGGVLVAVDSSQAFIDSTASGLLLNDVEVQPGAGSFVVAHAGGVHRYQIAAGLPLLDTWNKLTPIVDVETVTDGVFAAQDNGTAGQLDRLTVDLKNHPVATWDDLGAKPRMVDIKVSADETQLMAASVKGATQKSTRLAAAALVAGPSYALTASRTAYIKPDLSALLATDTGVYRVDAAGMSLLRFAPAAPGEREAEFVMEPVTNPVKGAIQISFFLPQTRHVRLRIFDLAGRQVAELVNGTRPAGRHDALWNAGERSGVFFYRLEAGSAKRSGKIVVIE